MKITKELFDKISVFHHQLKQKGISVGMSHPFGSFEDKCDDFVLFIDGDINQDTLCVENEKYYLVKQNEFQREENGIFVSHQYDLEKREKEVDDFLIDFHLWIKNGELKFPKETTIYFCGYKIKYKQVSDLLFYIEITKNNITVSLFTNKSQLFEKLRFNVPEAEKLVQKILNKEKP